MPACREWRHWCRLPALRWRHRGRQRCRRGMPGIGGFITCAGRTVPRTCRGPDGRLITAGLIADDRDWGNVRGPEIFDLQAFASLPRPFVVKAIDGTTIHAEDLVTGPADKRFSNITMALIMGNDIWIGTFAGDRVAYRSAPHSKITRHAPLNAPPGSQSGPARPELHQPLPALTKEMLQ